MAARAFTVTVGGNGAVHENASAGAAQLVTLSDALAALTLEVAAVAPPVPALTAAMEAAQAAFDALESSSSDLVGDDDVTLLIDYTSEPLRPAIDAALAKIGAHIGQSNLFTAPFYAAN